VKSTRIRVLCVDDHRLVREGIALIIASARDRDMTVVGSAATGEEAIEQFRRHRPDVTLMDLRLGGAVSGVDAIKVIRAEEPDARIVVLTMYSGDEDIHRALEAGAATYLLKDTLSDDLLRVIRDVHAGECRLPADVQAALDARANQRSLTPREIQVLDLVAKGKRNKEIAAILGISRVTVPVHLKHIFSKLDVTDRTAAVSIAVRRGIVHFE
jgi:DNA-binding NarL/FixJ family response regulator